VILIVEDDPEIHYLLCAILEGPHRRIIGVRSGAEAEAILDSETLDVVVLDLLLPDVDGRILLRQIRERPNTAAVPVVVISARGGREIREECYALGADTVTEKPFDPDEVVADVAVCIERAAARSGTELGWASTERVLRTLAEGLERQLGEFTRRMGVGHLGGGELVFLQVQEDGELVPESELRRAAQAAVECVGGLPLTDPAGESLRLTGAVALVPVDPSLELEDALGEARRLLFRGDVDAHGRVTEPGTTSSAQAATILVAEDDEISATILLHRLEKEGLHVVHRANGREAYEGALTAPPHLAILDVNMPGMDGFEVLERWRGTPALSGVPIIMLTSMGSEADIVRAFRLGADDYVLKPFSPVELSARVWRLLRRGRIAAASTG
jgi:DNA-binding response OmpR family regulator